MSVLDSYYCFNIVLHHQNETNLFIMKTLNDLMKLQAEAIESSKYSLEDWFFSFSGHVNKMKINYYFTGWKSDGHSDSIEQTLNKEGIQALYWFIKTRL